MELKALEGLGKVAGIGGIALGVLALALKDVLASRVFAALPPEQAAQLLMMIIVGSFLIGALGIVAWMLAHRTPAKPDTITATGGSVVMGPNARGNHINISHRGGTSDPVPKHDAPDV